MESRKMILRNLFAEKESRHVPSLCRNADTDVENKLVDMLREEGWMSRGSNIESCILQCVYWVLVGSCYIT